MAILSKESSFFKQLNYAKVQWAVWLRNLISAGYTIISKDFMMTFNNCTGEFKKFTKVFLEKLPELTGKKDFSYKGCGSVIKFLDESLYSIIDKLRSIFEEYPHLDREFALSMEEYLDKYIVSNQIEIPTDFQNAKSALKSLFQLDENDLKIIDLIFILKQFYRLDNGVESEMYLDRIAGRSNLANALNMSKPVLADTISKLNKLGIIDSRNDSLRFISDDFIRLWDLQEGEEPEEIFCSTLKGDTLPITDFSVKKQELKYLLDLLKSQNKKATHILLYGPPGTGKTTFVRSLATELGVKAWAVSPAVSDRAGELRRLSLLVTVNRAQAHPGALAVVDEAENLFTNGIITRIFGRTADKSWINDFMENTGSPVIWIVNYPRQIDMTTIRRFSFALYFPELGVKERKRMWEGVLSRNNVKVPSKINEFGSIVKNHIAPVAVIERAVRQAKEIGGKDRFFWNNVKLSLDSYEKLLKGGQKSRINSEAPEGFTLEGVTVGIDIGNFIKKLKATNALQDDDGLLPSGSGTMLFYGPPGTGKTALARHLGDALGKEVLTKRASDILNCFVGGTEQNIAQAFEEATEKDAILVIDEVDSFLYSREIAIRSWESSLVNEFLTRLEECRSFMIATSNRRNDLDIAAMRRFSFKVPFRYAGSDELKALYLALLAPLVKNKPDTDFLSRLSREKNLAPGDFRAVRLRSRLEKNLSHEHLFKELLMEQSMKLDKETARIGF
jgi:SpoVK/Ycf46/Vps4 family AAA+-type ATPase